jgi:hypothetical protein
MSYSYTCPFCQRPTTVTDEDVTVNKFHLRTANADGLRQFKATMVVCPNPDCKRFGLDLLMTELTASPGGLLMGEPLKHWSLIPASAALTFPDYVPKPVRDDYEEACLIVDLSPKASATLARRALQGMIRDYWKVSKARLIDGIEAIKDKVDPLTWAAIDAVRSVGNIGAHMENDINVIIDVKPEEANKLIQLIEILVKDWYVTTHDREERLKSVGQVALDKDQKKNSATASPQTKP